MCIFWRIWIFWLDCGYFASLMMCIWAISKKDRITISRSIISSWEGKMKFQNLISQSSGAFDHSKNQWFYQTTGQIHQIEKPDKNWRGPVVGCQIMIRYIWLSKIIEHFWLSQSIFHQKQHFEIQSYTRARRPILNFKICVCPHPFLERKSTESENLIFKIRTNHMSSELDRSCPDFSGLVRVRNSQMLKTVQISL